MPPLEEELLDELELLLELLDEEELDELELEEELLEDEELELDELLLDDELLDDDELLELLEPLGIEHSLTPPAIRPPKVAEEQTKLPLNTLKKN